MKKILRAIYVLPVLALPFLARAQSDGTIGTANLGELIEDFIAFINDFVIPFIWALAFIVFLFGLFKYFIQGGANEEQRDQGKQLVVWGIIAFFIMTSVWGIINLLSGTFRFDNDTMPDLPRFEQTTGGTPTPAPSGAAAGS